MSLNVVIRCYLKEKYYKIIRVYIFRKQRIVLIKNSLKNNNKLRVHQRVRTIFFFAFEEATYTFQIILVYEENIEESAVTR